MSAWRASVASTNRAPLRPVGTACRLDGESQPAGGMGVCRQAKDEIYDYPPVLLITGRPDDGWLATWSRADAVTSHPIDPRQLARELSRLMRARAERSPSSPA